MSIYIYAIMKTMCPPGYHHKDFVATHLASVRFEYSLCRGSLMTGVLLLLSGTEDYLKEACRQLNDKEVSEQVPDDPSVLANTLIKALEELRLRGDLSEDTLDYF